MSQNSIFQNDNQDIPLHTFGMELDRPHQEIPFACLSFSEAPALAQATYPHRHNFYEVLYVTAGAGTHFIDFNAYPIEPNTLYFISPGQVHYWETSVQIEGEILIFTDEFLLLAPADYMVLEELSFFHTVEGSPALHLNKVDHLQASRLLNVVAEEYNAYDFRAESVLRAYLHILLIQIQRIYAMPGNKDGNEPDKIRQTMTRKFKKLVANQFTTKQSVADYADLLGVTVNHLNKTVKAATGYTPGQLLRQEIVLEAKRLMRHTDLTATQIGYRLAFDDPSYFGRFFKREVGVSPGQFRYDMTNDNL